MLRELDITNIAIVKHENIRFNSGFSVITGETGAGKSIIIDCIGLIMGARASRELIRNGETSATVTAMFENIGDELRARCADNGIECGDTVVLTRELSLTDSGISSTARIEGKLVSASVMKNISSSLMNLHTQHASQTLMNDENHINYLDSFADTAELIAEYGKIYENACAKERELSSIKKSEQEKARLSEMLRFQINEIKSASLKPGEEESLEITRTKIQNAEQISKNARLVTRALYRNDKGMSASDMIAKASDAVVALGGVLKESEEFKAALDEIRYKLEDIAETVAGECDIGIANPSEMLDKIETRLDTIDKLKRKYGSTVDEIIAFRQKCEKELNDIETSDERCEDIKNELKTIYSELKTKASAITEKRRSAASLLEKRIIAELSDLEMDKVDFKVQLTPLSHYSSNGIDGVMFLVSTNTGEPLLPMSAIASGGELSRMMLAFKCALADKEHTGTLIFDEIDTGISGRTSHKIGLKMRSCTSTCQVICVTHSPQIASLAYEHLLVSKHETPDGRTESAVKALTFEERVKEISRIIGGEKITEKTTTAAKEMLDAAK